MFTDSPMTIEESVESERKEIVDHIRHFIAVWESPSGREKDRDNYKPLEVFDINKKFNLLGEDELPYDGLRIHVGQIEKDTALGREAAKFIEGAAPFSLTFLSYAKHIVSILKDLPDPTYVSICQYGNYFTVYYDTSKLNADMLIYVRFVYIDRSINTRNKMNVTLGKNNEIIIK